MIKLDILDHLMGPFLATLKLPEDDIKALTDCFASHADYRVKMRNKGWLGTLTEAGRTLSDLISTTVYGTSQDGVLKTTLKGTTAITEFLVQCPLLQGSMTEITNMAVKQNLHPATAAPAVDDITKDVLQEDLALTDVVDAELLQKDDGSLANWRDFAVNLVEQFVTIVVDDLSVPVMDWSKQNLGETVLPSCTGRAMLLYDAKIAGEASSNANCRIPSFRSAHLKRAVQSFVQVRQDADFLGEMAAEDMILILDGGKSGNETAINSSLVWTDGSHLRKEKHTFHLVYSEDSLADRREKTRGIVQQEERLYLYTSDRAAGKLFERH